MKTFRELVRVNNKNPFSLIGFLSLDPIFYAIYDKKQFYLLQVEGVTCVMNAGSDARNHQCLKSI